MRISDWSSDVCSSDLLLCQAQVDRMTHGAAHGLACLRIQPFPNLPNEPMRRHRVSLSIDRSDSSTIHARGLATSGGQGNPHLFQLSVERSEEHTSELQSLMRISYAVFCLKKKKKNTLQECCIKHNDTDNKLTQTTQ